MDGGHRRYSIPQMTRADHRRVWNFRDVSSQKLTEAALLESERQFRYAIEEARYRSCCMRMTEVLTISRADRAHGYTHADIPTIDAWTKKSVRHDNKAAKSALRNI